MKPAKTHIALATLAALGGVAATTIACSSKPKNNQVVYSQPVVGHVRPATLKIVEPINNQPAPAAAKSIAKPSPAKSAEFKSRDYGVSFSYPWQYSTTSAKAIAADENLMPSSDGSDAQFTLIRVEVPKGFYPDTNFESGYFTLSLNQDISEEQCESIVRSVPDAKVENESVNGVDFLRTQRENGGKGSAETLRKYVTFANATCYEIEMGVTTQNDRGLAREVNPDQVMRRLDAILKTVTITTDKSEKVEASAKSAEVQK
jgi:hypothetical protein